MLVKRKATVGFKVGDYMKGWTLLQALEFLTYRK